MRVSTIMAAEPNATMATMASMRGRNCSMFFEVVEGSAESNRTVDRLPLGRSVEERQVFFAEVCEVLLRVRNQAQELLPLLLD